MYTLSLHWNFALASGLSWHSIAEITTWRSCATLTTSGSAVTVCINILQIWLVLHSRRVNLCTTLSIRKRLSTLSCNILISIQIFWICGSVPKIYSIMMCLLLLGIIKNYSICTILQISTSSDFWLNRQFFSFFLLFWGWCSRLILTWSSIYFVVWLWLREYLTDLNVASIAWMEL